MFLRIFFFLEKISVKSWISDWKSTTRICGWPFKFFLTDDLYEILSSLPESVVYSCQPCLQELPDGEDVNGAGWRELLDQELRTGLERVLSCLLSSTLTEHLVTCKEVGIRSHLNLVCCTFKATATGYCCLFKKYLGSHKHLKNTFPESRMFLPGLRVPTFMKVTGVNKVLKVI